MKVRGISIFNFKVQTKNTHTYKAERILSNQSLVMQKFKKRKEKNKVWIESYLLFTFHLVLSLLNSLWTFLKHALVLLCNCLSFFSHSFINHQIHRCFSSILTPDFSDACNCFISSFNTPDPYLLEGNFKLIHNLLVWVLGNKD